ncbi:MAG: type II secretion system protein [Deltaproteobacteria bacterium]|nr:type II secretion system protein [Deltaproteobacteria bacterium]
MRAERCEAGFSLIEILVAVAILAILAGATAPLVVRNMTAARREETTERLQRLVDGMIGDPAEGRFGYLGDMGNLPPALGDLLVQGAQPAFAITAFGYGAGWSGPYVQQTQPLADLSQDAWGVALAYTAGTARVTSAGEDHLFGTADDLIYPATAPPTSGALVVTVLGIPNTNPATTVALGAAEASAQLAITSNGAISSAALSGVGPFSRASVPLGVHALVVSGVGSWAGASATSVLAIRSGNNAATVTLVQP